MPDPRDDLVRRGDVLDMIDAESHGDEGLAIIDSRDILALPADPVAAAAVALAEAVDNEQEFDSAYRGEEQRAEYDRRRAVTDAALDAYRAALAGREPRP